MYRKNLNRGWEFMQGEPSSIPGMPKETKTVNLPHDFMVEQDVTADAKGGAEAGFYSGGVGTYIKTLEFLEGELADVMELEFDGCFGLTRVSVNGSPAGRHHYGYTPFRVNIRPFVKVGSNRIVVTVNNDAQPNGRWYSGAGLYRGVKLVTSGRRHIAPDGIFVTTEHLAGNDAAMKAQITLCAKKRTAEEKEALLLRLICRKKESGEIAAQRVQKIYLTDEDTLTVTQKFVVEEADLWSPENPALYELSAELYTCGKDCGVPGVDYDFSGEEKLDEAQTIFGVRTIAADAKHGFMLNGKTLKLKGGCIHHDNGILGAESYYDAEYRKVCLHKENGYNALRLAHNPQSSQLLDICDELGVIVIDEAFDTWNMEKNALDFSTFFHEEWQQELEAMLLRDRNHPSVCFWSIGNELSEQGGLENGYQVSSELAAFVRKYDTSRLVCGALCSFFKGLNDEDTQKFWKALAEEVSANGGSFVNLDNSFGKKIWPEYTAPFVKDWDVVGYNYLSYHYETSHELFPDRVICCTESKPGEFEEYWGYVEKLPYLIGDFLWTSMDYIGEAGIGKCIYTTPEEAPMQARMLNYTQYPYRLAQAGDFDLCGNVKPQGAYHRILWGSKETYIFSKNPANYGKVELIGRYGWSDGGNHWTWPAESGSPAQVEVYSGADEVELILNGQSLGRKPAGKENHNKALFELTYEPGTLEAISYTGGVEISRDQVTTAGTPAVLRIVLEKTQIAANGESLAYGTVEIVDENGNYVPTAPDVTAKAEVTGAGELAGFGTGRASTEENYTTGTFTSYQGRWQIIVRGGYEAGEAKITVETEALGKAEAVVTVE